VYDSGVRSRSTGKERDAETGLDYFGARYFSSAQGRFTSPDWSATPQPVPYADLTDPQTLNLYSYVRNNPLSKADTDGHCGLWPLTCTSFKEFTKSLPDRIVGGLKGEANAILDMTVVGNHVGRFQASNAEQADAMAQVDAVKPELQTALTMAIPGPKGVEGEAIEPEVAPNFDAARTTAFEKAGMTNPADVKFSKVDPKTGTVVEFKGPNGAKVAYDTPHDSPGPGHDQPHVGWQTEGKRSAGGTERGNIPYEGSQHPSRPNVKGDGDIKPE
jgi:RHS repeat-associated protein